MTIRINARRKDGKLDVTYSFENSYRTVRSIITKEQYEKDMAHEREIRAARDMRESAQN